MNHFISAQKILTLSFLLLISSVSVYGSEIEYRLNLGVWTEHYYQDKAEYNEDSELIQFTIAKGPWFVTTGTFINSYKTRSHFGGGGYEHTPSFLDGAKIGNGVLAITGYEEHTSTMYKDLLILPVFYLSYNPIVLTIFGSAINAGIEFTW